MIVPPLSTTVSFQRRRCGTQHQRCIGKLSELLSCLPRVILRARFTFIAQLMFLVHQDHPEVWKRHKQRRPWTDDNIQLSSLCPPALILFFPDAERRVHHGNPVAEARRKPLHRLIGQRDFRDQHDGLSSSFYHALNERQINLCFSAARDTVDQARPAVILVKSV